LPTLYGRDDRYQFTADELRSARQAHEIKMQTAAVSKQVPFNDLGGDGYNP
jgi:hypothetical protein